MRRLSVVLLAALALSIASCQRDRAVQAAADEHAGHTTAAPAAPSSGTAATTTQPAAVPRIRFGEASGYLAAPSTPGKKPGLIVIQEWWGLDDWVRQQTDRFAQQGYVALAVDLYRGRVASSPDEAHELSRGLPEDRAMADLKAGVDLLSARPDVDPKHIGVIGWCMGGGYALALATNDPRVTATAINYGRLVTDHSTIARIHGEVLGNFGAEDRGIPPEDVRAFGQALTKAGKLGDIKIYDGAGHAFMNPNNQKGYNAAAAQDAQARIDRFFDRTLRAKIPNS